MLYMLRQFLLSVSVAILCMRGYADSPTAVGLENMAKTLRGDVRLIAMGDSYCAPYFARVPLAGLRVWPIENISAICSGAPMNSHMFICSAQCNPVALIQSTDKFGYTVERSSPATYFTLPLRGLQEIYTSKTFDDEGSDQLFEFGMNYSGFNLLSNGVHGRFAELGDDLAFRFLYRCPTDRAFQVEQIKLLDYSEEVGIMQLQDGARPLWHLGEDATAGSRLAVPAHINAAAGDYPARNNIDGYLKMRLEQIESLVGSNQYFEPAGCVYYHRDAGGNREEGLYYGHVADDSWSYSGFGCNTEGVDTHDKRYSLEQFTHWLDVTTLDRNQPTVFLWYLAPENLDYDDAKEQMTNMIDQADSAATLVGLQTVHHLIVVSHLFDMPQFNSKEELQLVTHQQNAAYDLASLRPNVAAASIFEATDHVMFTGTAAIPWLVEHGFDAFEFGTNSIDLVELSNGDLLDTLNVHPKNPEAAAFFSAILGDIIREAGCPADLVPNGITDVHDLLLVIGNWGGQGEGDINEDGNVSILDILHVIDGWGECWPVQAPFSTSYFK
jgi:hypothetical protein